MFSNTYKKSHHKPHMTIYHTPAPPALLPLLVLYTKGPTTVDERTNDRLDMYVSK